MGMSTHVVGLRPPDDDFNKMKAIWDACEAAGVCPPGDVLEFFDHEKPDPMGVEVSLTGRPPIAREWSGGEARGYEVDIADLPEGVKTIRFYNSW